MARARNIKPGFFDNEKLAALDPLARLLFAGLWTLADREGRLEDRPKRIKLKILGYDDCDIDALLQSLHDSCFIQRYSMHDSCLIQVCNWKRHQSPHHKEVESELPPPNQEDSHAQAMHDSSMGQEQPKQDASCPTDTLNLDTDSLNPITEEPNGSSSSGNAKPPPCPHKQIIDLYNEILPELTSVNPKLWDGSSRAKNLATRWKEDTERQKLDWWRQLFEYVRGCPWLMGEVKPWQANLGWLVKRENFDKVMEGEYLPTGKDQPDPIPGMRPHEAMH